MNSKFLALTLIFAATTSFAKNDREGQLRTCTFESMEDTIYSALKEKVEETISGQAEIVEGSFRVRTSKVENTQTPLITKMPVGPSFHALINWLLVGTNEKFALQQIEANFKEGIEFHFFDVSFRTTRGNRIVVENLPILKPYQFFELDGEGTPAQKYCVTGVISTGTKNHVEEDLGSISDFSRILTFNYEQYPRVVATDIVFKNAESGGILRAYQNDGEGNRTFKPITFKFDSLIKAEMTSRRNKD